MKEKTNIFLIGFMGVGKSTMGRMLAEKLSYEFIDMDQVIEKQQGKSITEIFEENGEMHFRTLESKALLTLSEGFGKVVACGGGAVIKAGNREVLKKSVCTVFLKADLNTLFDRIKQDKTRPLLGLEIDNEEQRQERFKERYESRESAYKEVACIHVATDNKTKEEIVDTIIEKYKIYYEGVKTDEQ